MSDDETMARPPGAAPTTAAAPDAKPRYRSWRKKYRKMKTRFDDVIKDSNTLFVDEQKLEALSKRLQEQNDQLLDLLLDLNSSLSIPHPLRFNLSTVEPTAEERDMTLDMANSIIKNAYKAVQNDNYPQSDFVKIREEVEAVLARKNSTSLAALARAVPHPQCHPELDRLPPHAALSHPAFLSSAHEDEALARIDAKLGNALPLSQPRAVSPPALSKLSQRELDREVELRNPLSVHNWLKKHGTISDVDNSSEPGQTSQTPATANKRRNLAKKVGDKAVERAREKEGSPGSAHGAEDDVAADDTPGKRKGRDDDQTYRPKGGRTKAKRKRGDTEGAENGAAAARGKKPRTSNAAPAQP